MPKKQTTLESELKAIESRIAKREAANRLDRNAANKLKDLIEFNQSRARAQSMLNAKVILNPDMGFGDKRLKALRGVQGTVTSIGRKNVHVTFDGADADDRGWTLPFDFVVPATPENLANVSWKISDAISAMFG
jgi:hypothetical protein